MSQKIAMLPGGAIQHWDVPENDLLSLGVKSLTNTVSTPEDKASTFPFAFVLPSKQAEGLARHLLQLSSAFSKLKAIRAHGGRAFAGDVVQSLCRWLRAKIQYGSADHSRTVCSFIKAPR